MPPRWGRWNRGQSNRAGRARQIETMSVSDQSRFQVIDGGEGDGLPEYPFAPDLRLDTHHFVTWLHRRYLNSTLRLRATPEVKCFAIELFCIAQDQTPVGTLPDDDHQLSLHLNVSLSTWQELLTRPISPLYKWYRCRCGGEVRFTHPVVIEVIGEALKHQRRHAANSEKGRRAKRLKRLSETVVRLGGSTRLAANPAALEWLDEWLEARCEGNRTGRWIEKSMEAWSAEHS